MFGFLDLWILRIYWCMFLRLGSPIIRNTNRIAMSLISWWPIVDFCTIVEGLVLCQYICGM